MSKYAFALFALLVLGSTLSAAPHVLFDNGHAQTAGNADWTIYGGYSDMADAARFLGCTVSEQRKRVTRAALHNVDIFVSPEPNSAFSKDEKTALLEFLNKGGCLFLIADHDKSDRNRDGIDSVGVINQIADDIGIRLNKKWFSEHPITGEAITSHPVMEGVVSLGTWGGTSLEALSEGAQVLARESHGGGYIGISEVGKGRVVVMGDSSPFDDGSGNPKDKLHDGWSNPGYTHERLAYNALRWLLRRPNDRDADKEAFSQCLSSLNGEEQAKVGEALERSIKKHQKTIRKIKREEVRQTWQEDLSWLEELKTVQHRAKRFSALYSDM